MNKNENEKYEGFGISLIWNITHLLGAWRNCYRTLKLNDMQPFWIKSNITSRWGHVNMAEQIVLRCIYISSKVL